MLFEHEIYGHRYFIEIPSVRDQFHYEEFWKDKAGHLMGYIFFVQEYELKGKTRLIRDRGNYCSNPLIQLITMDENIPINPFSGEDTLEEFYEVAKQAIGNSQRAKKTLEKFIN